MELFIRVSKDCREPAHKSLPQMSDGHFLKFFNEKYLGCSQAHVFWAAGIRAPRLQAACGDDSPAAHTRTDLGHTCKGERSLGIFLDVGS